MRRKGLFAFMIAVLGMFTVFGCFNFQNNVSFAETTGKWEDEVATESFDYVMTTNSLKIYTAKGLAYLANQVNNNNVQYSNFSILLENDIDLGGKEWTPIQKTNASQLSANFDGQHHTISNMTITNYTGAYVGLFGYVAGGSIKNINLTNVNISTGSNVSGEKNIGGIAGVVDTSAEVVIEGCYVDGEITLNSSNSNVGGIVGRTTRNISKCKSSVSISGEVDSRVGGIVGFVNPSANATISEVGFDGEINGPKIAGGIVGDIMMNNNVEITNVYSNGEVCVDMEGGFAGGLFGRVRGNSSSAVLSVSNAYNASTLSGDINSIKAGIAGEIINYANCSFENVYQTEVIGEDVISISSGDEKANFYAIGMNVSINNKPKVFDNSKLNFKRAKASYAGFDFENKWKFDNYTQVNSGLPTLLCENDFEIYNSKNELHNGAIAGEGTLASPYLIYTPGDLAHVALNLSSFNGKYFLLMNNLDLSGKTWIPVGYDVAFTGIFDGNGHTIKGLNTSHNESFSYYGIFGKISGAIIKNLNVKETEYLTPGENSGEIVGFVEGGDSYFINVNFSGAKAIGKNDVNYVKGKNSNFGTYTYYDVELDTNGGYILGLDGNMGRSSVFVGEYRLIFDGSGIAELNLNDESYQTEYPKDTANSSEVGKYLIKTGYKRTGYTTTNYRNTLKVVANWEESTKKVTFYKNPYARYAYGAEEIKEEQDLAYDSVLQEAWPEILEVEREGFTPKFYLGFQNGNFSNEIDKNVWLFEDRNVYVKWESDNETEFTFAVSFEKAEGPAGVLDYSRAIKNVKLVGFADGSNTTINMTDDGNGNFTANFKTIYAFTANTNIKLSVELNDGYRFDGNLVDINFFPNLENQDYGNVQKTLTLGKGKNETTTKFDLTLVNLTEDYEIELPIQRDVYIQEFEVDGYMAFAPVADFTNGLTFNYLGEDVGLTLSTDSSAIGFDPRQGRFVSNEHVVGGIGFGVYNRNVEVTAEAPLFYTIKGANQDRYFTFSLYEDLAEYKCYVLNEVNISRVVLNEILRIYDYSDPDVADKLQYYSLSEFSIIYTTNDSSVGYGVDNSGITGAGILDDEPEKHNKLFKTYEIGDGYKVGQASPSLINENGRIADHGQDILMLSAVQTKIILSYMFVDGDGNEISSNLLPTLENEPYMLTTSATEVTTDPFEIVPSLLYKVDSLAVEKKNGENWESFVGLDINEAGENLYTFTYSNSVSAGDYRIKLVCSKIEYTISLFNAEYSDDINMTRQKITGTSLNFVTPTSSKGGNLYTYDDKNITFTATMPTYNGDVSYSYIFYGWWIDGVGFVQYGPTSDSQTTDFTTDFEALYAQAKQTEFELKAIFRKKTFDLKLDERILLANDDVDDIVNLSDSNLTIRMSVDSNLTFTKAGYSKDGYYLAGYRIFYLDNIIDTENAFGTGAASFTYSQIKNIIENYMNADESLQNSANSINITIVPIVAKRTAKIKFSSGTSSSVVGAEVYDGDNQNTTDVKEEIVLQYGETCDFAHVNNNNMDYLFNRRVGYTKSGNYWKYKIGNVERYISSPQITLSADKFSGVNGNQISIDISIDWTPVSYIISMNANGGSVNRQASTSVTSTYYGSDIREYISVSRQTFEYYGFEFDGLTCDRSGEEVVVFNKNLVLQDDNGIFNAAGKLVVSDDVVLKAKWVAAKKSIKILTNGADINDYVLEYTYGNTFADLLNVLIPEKNLQRVGFEYVGLKVVDSNVAVLSTDVFDRQFNGFVVEPASNEQNLTLYVDWDYDNSYSFEFSDGYVSRKVVDYIADYQEFSIGDFLYDDGVAQFVAVGYQISYNEILAISPFENTHIETQFAFVSDNGESEQLDEQKFTFRVRNAGLYSVLLSVMAYDDAIYNNKGMIGIFNVSVSVDVRKVDISVTLSDDIKLANVKNLLKDVVSQDFYQDLRACANFAEFVDLMKATDTSVSTASAQEIYDYVIIKYYLQITNSDYLTYRAWSYDDYADYKEENLDNVNYLLSILPWFVFYDYAGGTESQKFSATYLDYVDVEGVSGCNEISARELEILNESQTISPRARYSVRVWFAANDVQNFANYNISSEGEEYYFDIDKRVLVLPQVLFVKNKSQSKEAFYKSFDEVEIAWYEGYSEKITHDNADFYGIGDYLYMNANLTTSNRGSKDVDTRFSTYETENALYYQGVRILGLNGNDFFDVTRDFCVLPDADDVYTIINTKNVASISILAKMLTYNQGVASFGDLPSGVQQDLFKITRVKYNDGGVIKTIYNENGLEIKNYDGFEIVENNANCVTIFTSQRVVSFSVEAGNLSLNGTNLKLYKWSDDVVYDVDGTMATDGNYEVFIDELEYMDSGISYMEMYGVYTDLVKVNFQYNFPSTYQVSSLSSTTLKLDESVEGDLYIPSENGFKLEHLRYKDFNGNLVDYTNLFNNAQHVFDGIPHATDKYLPITLYTEWSIEPLQYEQHINSFKVGVGKVDFITYSYIVRILNENRDLYNLTFEWSKDGNIVSTNDYLEFEYGGLTTDSGEYILTITPVINEDFASAVTEPAEPVVVTINIEFVAQKITQVEFVGENEVVYNAQNKLSAWNLELTYFEYDSENDDYETTAKQSSLYYTPSGVFYFEVEKDGVAVDEMKNVGVYTLKFLYSAAYYNCESGVETEFEYEITPYTFNLQDVNTDFEKRFNTEDPQLSKDISTGIETISVEFERESGESVGEYDIVLKQTQEDVVGNYILKFGDDVVSNAGVVDNTIAVGTFEIETSGQLKVYYEVSELNSQNLVVPYSANGYSLNLTNNFGLQVVSNGSVVKNLTLVLFDVEKNEIVSDAEILAIINSKTSAITPKLLASDALILATSSAVYDYQFDTSALFDCYSSITFETGYQFTISQIVIHVADLTLDKTFDNSEYIYFDTNGNVVDYSESREVYIVGTYATKHVGNNIRVDLRIVASDADVGSNYQLDALSSVASISKRNVRASVSPVKASFVYGEVSQNNFESCFGDVQIFDGVRDVSNWLSADQYVLTLSLPSSARFNDAGCLYAGTYAVTQTSSFNDFEISEFSIENIVVSVLEVEHGLVSGMFRRLVGSANINGPYSDEIYLPQTDDTISLEYYTQTAGELPLGEYDLVLQNNMFKNSSVRVVLNENNKALHVISSDKAVYLELTDASVLRKVYNGSNYEISVDLANQKVVVSNGSQTFESAFTLTSDEVVDISEIDSISLFYGTNTTSFKNAGNYKLNVSIESNQYPNILLQDEYLFVVEKKEIDATQFVVQKVYDGTQTLEIDIQQQDIVDGDDVYVVATFDTLDAGQNKNVSLSLQGTDSANYVLSSTSANGDIEKADANVVLSKVLYTYGEFARTNSIVASVVSGGVNVSAYQYTLSLQIENATYSASAWEYLNVGHYNILMNAESTNYNLTLQSDAINVVPYAVDALFETSGLVSVQYGSASANVNTFEMTYMTDLNENITLEVTRQAGRELGYYKALSATTANTNYVINSVSDTSAGIFRIVKSSETLYILPVDEQGNLLNSVEEEYSGYEYNSISLSSVEDELCLVFDYGFGTKIVAVKTFVYNDLTEEYTAVEAEAQDLAVEFAFDQASVKNVGSYSYHATSATASNYQIRLERFGQTTSSFVIVQKQLYFKQRRLSKVFDNKIATFVFDDARDVLTGVVGEEELGLRYQFFDGAIIARYVNNLQQYTINAELVGEEETKQNYHLNLKNVDDEDVYGVIDYASIRIIFNSRSIVYGNNITLSHRYQINIEDQDDYDESKIQISLSIKNQSANLSSAGFLKPGQYEILCDVLLEDFAPIYVVDGNERVSYDENKAFVNVSKKGLAMSAVSGTLTEIFTKQYDATTNCQIVKDGNLLIAFDGVMSGDDIELVSARYETATLGKSIPVTFEFDGVDKDCYEIEPWAYGVINPIVVAFNFDYGVEDPSSIQRMPIGYENISVLAFPFMSSSSLTTNSNNPDTANMTNFPESLIGRNGYEFVSWTLKFENVEENSAKYVFLSNAVENIGMTYKYEDETFEVQVGNNALSVAFLNALINDDTDNLFGMYFGSNQDISVTFVAKWKIQTYKLSFVITDKNGASAQYGQVVVDGQTITDRISNKEFEFGTRVELVATPVAHCTFYRLYYANGRAVSGDDEGISSYRDGVNTIIVISSISKNYDLQIRFDVQSVNVVVDLSAYANSTLSNNKFTKNGNVYTWNTGYFSLTEVSISALGISRVGYELESVGANGTTIYANDFETTMLSEFVESEESGETISFVPGFDPVGVVVNLDYDYGDKIEIAVAEYEGKYEDATGWEESPTREGYTFQGWFDDANQITGQSVVSKIAEHTLIAHWQIASFDLEINAQNVKLFVDNVEVSKIETSVEFEGTYEFVVVAADGYLLPATSSYPACFTATAIDATHANVVVTMPGADVRHTICAVADENTLTFVGDRISRVRVFDMTTTETEISVDSNTAVVETGKTLKIVVEANTGYDMSTNVDTSVDYLNITKSVEDGVLTMIVEGVKEDVEFEFFTQEGLNVVDFTFDDTTKIAFVVANDRSYTDLENIRFMIYTGQTFDVYVGYVEGYKFKGYSSEEGIVATAVETTYNNRESFKITLSNIIEGAIEIEAEAKTFTLELEIVSYDTTGSKVETNVNTAKIVYDMTENTTCTAEYLSEVSLIATAGDSYSFAGWSKNQTDIFDENSTISYTITKDEKIYAVFSAVKFDFNFATLVRTITMTEYNDPAREVVSYEEVSDIGEGYYLDSDLTQGITQTSVFYGSSATIFFKSPKAYSFVGYGHYVGDEFVLIDGQDYRYNVDAFTIQTNSDIFDIDNPEETLYVVIEAKSLRINITTKIDFDGHLEENPSAGIITLTTEDGGQTNEYGYVEGTKIHYLNFESVDFMNYRIVAFTKDEVYLKVEVQKDGYKFKKLSASLEDVEVEEVVTEEDYVIYKLSNLEGGSNFDVNVLFRPVLNKISIDFAVDEDAVDAGVFNVHTQGNNSYKVFNSGVGHENIVVSAYTGSEFEVEAYISLGYTINENNIVFDDENALVDRTSIVVERMSETQTGYGFKISFKVSGYLGDNILRMIVAPRKYVVKFVEDSAVLFEIRNVEFGKDIDISQENAQNIVINSTGVGYKDGKLNLVFAKEKYNYQGFFTYENGAGARYVDSTGNLTNVWSETGYFYNLLTSRYEIAKNAVYNTSTGNFEISLYIYWSYLKTRITFDFVPGLDSVVSAKDVISGVDYTNSWYYEASPNYIEVSYNTSVRINAPEISGYKFYKFVISQKKENGEELSDVVTYSNNIPWETNELDNIYEVYIQVVYFAEISVNVSGGVGDFVIEQAYENAKARELVEQNYVDTTKSFKITALPAKGYEFVSWFNTENGRHSWEEGGVWEDAKVTNAAIFILTLQGKQIELVFQDEDGNNYDSTYGQMLTARITTLTGARTETLGKTINGQFTILKSSINTKVGDKIRFTLSIVNGFGVVWNREGVKFAEMASDKYIFDFDVSGDLIDEEVARVIPTFKNTILSVYVDRLFGEDQIGLNAIDGDNVNIAGYTTYAGEKTDEIFADREKDVNIGVKVSARYAIVSARLFNKGEEFDVLSKIDNDILTISKQYADDNNIIGVARLVLKFKRVLWEETEVDTDFVGNGQSVPYQINTINDLILMMQRVNNGLQNDDGTLYSKASYILNNDLDISNAFWTPIGTEENPFDGTFNFNGHVVKGIYNAFFFDTVSHNGLFGVLGSNAKFIEKSGVLWYWYISAAAVAVLTFTIVAVVFVSRKRRNRRNKMAAK